ncbi:retina-specific copper amine oxidase isoform X4 [Camelus ferus]|uniref:Amine oxidase n=1 Tax=Camelus ferus TaxID=419612 RepID=A0A8B8R7F7_CAMFR|nr:retina-specific copper amine oxidase isoform X4 [Camelus ferus]
MNLKVVLVFLALSLITIFALAYVLLTSQGGSSQPPRCPSVSHSAQPWTHPGQSQLFADLSREELMAVMSFLTQKLGPGLVDAAQARPFDNCVFSVELQLPRKAAALAHLDRGSPPPAREALAIVFFGGQPQPNVTELVVGPLPRPSYMRDVTVERHGGPLPYHRRPVLRTESAQMWKHLKEVELPKAPVFLASVFNYSGSTLAGLKNWVVAEDVVFKPVAAPWSPEHQLQRPQLTRQVLGREDLTAFLLGSPLPRYLYLASNQTNAWGHQRGYRIQIHSPFGIHMPLDSDMERALSWGRYQLAVTRRKEKESQSSSIYYQNDIWTPTMAFADFINNETLLGEDLVAWVTASFLHIPHAEDVPNTVTLGNRVGFLLRPYNFFDEDPSIFSPDSVYFEKDQNAGLCSVNHVACIPHLASCVPDLPPFSYQDF